MQITVGTGASMRHHGLDAAIERNDEAIQMRMLAYPDLFGSDGKYHHLCYSHYISENNIKAAKRKM